MSILRKSKVLHLFFFLIFLPFIIVNDIFHITGLVYRIFHKKSLGITSKAHLTFGKIVKKIISACFLIPLCMVWISGYAGIIMVFGFMLGVIPMSLQTAGKSMLPTLADGEIIYTYPADTIIRHRIINRGDIVIFSNKDTVKDGKQVGFVKRIVGVPGDQIEIRNGYLYINSDRQLESYILKSRSTFGNTFIRDCQKVTVPNSSYFVLGDNRKRSQDSRMFGFVPRSAISYDLPKSSQSKYISRWTLNEDNTENITSFINIDDYVNLINKKREESKVKPLKYEPKLSKSAESRAKIMLKYNDMSFEATKSGYTMAKATTDANYDNVIYGEYPIFGYFDAQELVDYEFENPEGKKFLLNKDYQDIGLSTFVGELDGCPVQIIVQHLAGYVPPNYNKSDIDSWKKSLEDLNRVTPSWEEIKDYSLTYTQHKQDVDRLLEILHLRISRTQQIINKMEKGQWLTTEETKWINDEQALFNEEEAIAKRLNSFQWQH